VDANVIKDLGDAGGSVSNPCGVYEGDRDGGDEQCGLGLTCYQRDAGQPVPGCTTSDISGNLDLFIPISLAPSAGP